MLCALPAQIVACSSSQATTCVSWRARASAENRPACAKEHALRSPARHGGCRDELVIDQERYAKHEGCGSWSRWSVDEAGHIENPRGLESDLSGQHGKIAAVV